ncbi:PLP-dependent aminotransferase family protein [Corallococcus praedator]|uniref:PLP-dependent aminotransferase family protein n=2 Tax=Myxococcaceae TaxID=31 RepID=A0ABX9Q4Z9_9BACT|nr:PLP-dependent aminotransferase family protein [Corallococcus sp. CA047B]RKH21900.1 PLP-dependent aminotransferase family protein [Corallococcus sp. CA031C]RKH91525.1 PLP-dependent aminotransferase family protein [Corallococcus praedator]
MPEPRRSFMTRAPWKPRLKRSDGPLYAALVDALAADISAGRLRAGDRLPTHRELAVTVGASLGTVTRAYAEAERRGLIRAQVGNGTFVRDLTEMERYSPQLDRTRIDLGPTAVPIVPGDLGHLALAAALKQLGERADLTALSGYQSHGGSESQRAAGARWLGLAGVPASEAEVTVCGGAQHATLMLLSLLATPEGVLVEDVTYPGALAAAEWLRLPTHPVALDADGLIPEALAEACRKSGARVLYCTPTNHNPTTAIMPLQRRQAVLEVCREFDVALIENGALAPLVAKAPPPLAALAPERTYHLGSLSKALLPALRVGYIRAPAHARLALEQAAAATVWSGSPLMSELASRWIADGTAEALRDARRSEAMARQSLAASVLKGHPYVAHATAYFLWMPIPEHRRATELVEQAAARDVLLGPAHLFAARPGNAPNALRVSLGAASSRAELERGLKTLAELLEVTTPAPRSMR